MKFFGSTAVILLVIVVTAVLSDCPDNGCECGEFCVDINNRWCNSNNDRECSCVKGCLVFDQMMLPGATDNLYCTTCLCSTFSRDGTAVCIGESFCLPANLTLHVDYPATENESPNCPTTDENGDNDDYNYDDIIITGSILYNVILYYGKKKHVMQIL
ncbi:hypothetical protein ACJMK2_022699 [Sinanodonta woodiana]|uniref:Uncharacterized protein n=1 Tax=Sinanodonta woodiana TaxID=1069815 RepID=A0ABD3TJU9_SINWO